MLWLITEDTYKEMEACRVHERMPTQEQQSEYEAVCDCRAGELPRIMSVAGSNAAVNITGVLTDTPDLFARWFGGGNTTYREIQTSLAIAESDPEIKTIMLNINSPGGQASTEWLETMRAVGRAKKPTVAFVGGMAASAAYGIASQAGTITAQNDLSMLGSVGVVQTQYVRENVVEVTSSNAPKKRPDATTDEGKRVIREEIDAIESVFIKSIAQGRRTTEKNVKRNFGQGGIVLAQDALEEGMIDNISDSDEGSATRASASATATKTQTAAVAGGVEKESVMDLNTLKAEHPAVYQAAVEDGRKQGIEDERERVAAHMTFGENCDCMDIASKAIKEGKGITPSLQAQYMTAGRNKVDREDRQEDEEKVAEAAADVAEPADDKDLDTLKVLELVEANCGVQRNG